jgi:3-hydroxyacyl-[acyl-carrier-protein] dehydratase
MNVLPLLDNFYREQSSTFKNKVETQFSSTIELNPNHEIYKGHFVEVPVAPGVCLVQIIKEILMAKFEVNLILSEASNIKFLLLINPKENNVFQLDFTLKITDNIYDVAANYVANVTIFTKFKGKFKLQ